jgi:hypothetical protein
VKFLLDHDVPGEVARLLRHWSHDAVSLRQVLAVTTPANGAVCFSGLGSRDLVHGGVEGQAEHLDVEVRLAARAWLNCSASSFV